MTNLKQTIKIGLLVAGIGTGAGGLVSNVGCTPACEINPGRMKLADDGNWYDFCGNFMISGEDYEPIRRRREAHAQQQKRTEEIKRVDRQHINNSHIYIDAYNNRIDELRIMRAQRDNENLLKFLSGGLLGAVAEGAGDSQKRTWQENAGIRGFARGVQHQRRNQAIRDQNQNVSDIDFPSAHPLNPLACCMFNYWSDINDDGFFSPEEIRNIKSNFNSNETIYFISAWHKMFEKSIEGKKVNINLVCMDNGKIIYDYFPSPVRLNYEQSSGPIRHICMRQPAQEIKQAFGGYRFRVIWTLDGEPRKFEGFSISGE
jgi:hypothetical protein